MKSILLLAIVLLASCSSTKNTNSIMDTNESTSKKSTEMMENGYLAGTIVISEAENDCPFTIKIKGEDGAYFYDPINLDETYKKDGEKIWFTFNGLRMMNRCAKASPISLTDIQKRAE